MVNGWVSLFRQWHHSYRANLSAVTHSCQCHNFALPENTSWKRKPSDGDWAFHQSIGWSQLPLLLLRHQTQWWQTKKDQGGSCGKDSLRFGECSFVCCLVSGQFIGTFFKESCERGDGGAEAPYELPVVLGEGQSVTAATLASSMDASSKTRWCGHETSSADLPIERTTPAWHGTLNLGRPQEWQWSQEGWGSPLSNNTVGL